MTNATVKDNLSQGFDKLSQTETQILDAIKEGHTSEEIATSRQCSIRTIEKHRSNIIRKLGLSGKTNALVRWVMLDKA